MKGCGLLFPLLQGITQFCDSMVTTNMNTESIKGMEKMKNICHLSLSLTVPLLTLITYIVYMYILISLFFLFYFLSLSLLSSLNSLPLSLSPLSLSLPLHLSILIVYMYILISYSFFLIPLLPLSLFIVSMESSLSLLSNCLYMSVAQYIPHLLRQWYLTLDRQTSNLISRYNDTLITVYWCI